MATEDEGKQPEEGQEGSEGAQDAGAEKEPKDEGKQPEEGQEDVKDKHGQPGINKERHEKEMAAKDAEIAELKAQIAKAAETKEGREKLEQRIAELEEKQAEERTTHKLELAGCKDVKAAKARLEDFDGDVSKLKSECPYLFESEKQTGRAGGKPGGAPDSLDEKIDQAMGIKKRKD